MVTEKQVEHAMKKAIKSAEKAMTDGAIFDELAGKYFGIDDFSQIYEFHGEIVDALQYGTADLTWDELCKAVEKFRKEKINNKRK
jgi:hypothetical protein